MEYKAAPAARDEAFGYHSIRQCGMAGPEDRTTHPRIRDPLVTVTNLCIQRLIISRIDQKHAMFIVPILECFIIHKQGPGTRRHLAG